MIPLAGLPLGSIIKYGGAAMIFGVVFFGGCHLQSKRDASEIEEWRGKASKATDDRDAWRFAAGEWKHAAALQNESNVKRVKEAEAQKVESDQAVKRANAAAERLLRRHAEIDKSIADAKQDPACRRLLETTTCAALQ